MFGKSLFKQSCKANGTMWIIITVAVCFMLSCVMLIAGNGDLGDTKVVIEDAIVEGELTAQTQGRAIEYYSLTDETLRFFDSRFQSEFAAFSQENDMQKAIATACSPLKTNIIRYCYRTWDMRRSRCRHRSLWVLYSIR